MVTREDAEARVRRNFVVHCLVYCLVNAGLGALNYYRNPERLWFLWVVGGWGIGILIHGVLYSIARARERMVERVRARMENRRQA